MRFCVGVHVCKNIVAQRRINKSTSDSSNGNARLLHGEDVENARHVARSTNMPRELNYASADRLRLLFFASLGIILLTFLVLTLPRLPYPAEAGTPDRIVLAVGKLSIRALRAS